MIDSILLFPYWLALKTRHFLFNKGIRKSYTPEVPAICIGNITVGGTGKTPHTEMILKYLLEDEFWGSKNLAVLSRGYKRQSKGFQQVPYDGSATLFGDEPMQIKNKFPLVTVAVDKSRKEGCRFLCNPELLHSSKKASRCIHKDMPKADLIILDDAFQHRAIKPSVSIVLVDYNRPVFKDHLLPLGRLRDLRERIHAADIVIVTKCPSYIDGLEKDRWKKALGISDRQHLFFTTVRYDAAKAIYKEGDPRYVYSQKLILFSGIANDKPFRDYLSDSYKILKHMNFPDHHKFSKGDMAAVRDAAAAFPTSVIMTTEKDSQRVRACSYVAENIKTRMFHVPIKSEFVPEQDKDTFINLLKGYLK